MLDPTATVRPNEFLCKAGKEGSTMKTFLNGALIGASGATTAHAGKGSGASYWHAAFAIIMKQLAEVIPRQIAAPFVTPIWSPAVL